MTVRELIARLQGMPPDARVVTDHYEVDLGEVSKVALIRIRPNPSAGEYIGDWERVDLEESGAEEAVYVGEG